MSSLNGEPDPHDEGPGADRKKVPFLWPALLVCFFVAVFFLVANVILTRFSFGPKIRVRVMSPSAEMAVFETALEAFKRDTGRFPTTEEVLQALVKPPPAGLANWDGPYLTARIPNDPWGNPYVYVCPGVHKPDSFDLHSLGPSGQDGADDNIDNWSGP